MPKLRVVLVILSALDALARGAGAAMAQGQDSTTSLPTVRVTGRASGGLDGVPGALTIIGPGLLRDRAPLSVMDALRTVPGVLAADEDPYGLNLNISFRGLPPRRSARTLLLEDGVPVLLGPYGDPSMHYAPPIDAIERIEVVKGSSQVMNGPQTLGGVVDFITRGPPSSGREGRMTLGGGGEGHRSAHAWFGATGGSGAGVSADFAYREGPGVRLEQGHRMRNLMLKGVVPISGSQQLLLKVGRWDEASRISETGLTQAEFEAAPYSLPFTAQGRFDVRRRSVQGVHELRRGRLHAVTNAFLTHTTRASWRQSGESAERLGEDGYADDFRCAPGATSYAQCGNQGRPRTYRVAGLEPRIALDLGDRRHGASVEAGLRLLTEDARRRQYAGATPRSRVDEAVLTRDNSIATLASAAFVQARLRTGRFAVTPAVRVERVAQEVRNRFPGSEARLGQSYTQVLPGLGATLGVGERLVLFAGVHRGFAPPRPADVYDPEPGQPIVLVDPETNWSHELGVRTAATMGIAAELTLFRMDFGNEVIEAPASAGQRFVNGGRATHAGLEAATQLSLGSLLGMRDDLVLSGALTLLPVAEFREGDQRDDLVGNRVPYAPRVLWSASASWAHRRGLTLGLAWEHTGAQFADAENTRTASADGQEGTLPAYTVTNAFASWALPSAPLELRLSMRNLLDRVYITQRNEGIWTGMRRFVRAEAAWRF